jgi:hypothetical protein
VKQELQTPGSQAGAWEPAQMADSLYGLKYVRHYAVHFSASRQIAMFKEGAMMEEHRHGHV